MKLVEAIKLINDPEEDLYCIGDAEDLIDYEKELASDIDIDRHRWYETSTSYYQLEDGILGISGLSNIYSESTSASDCCVRCHAFKGEEYTAICYRPQNGS